MNFLILVNKIFFLVVFVELSQGAKNSGKVCEIDCKHTRSIQTLNCTLDPESLEGPFYLPLHLLRHNITEDRPGVPLKISFIVMDSSTCEPLPNATVDIWHSDASGFYSGFASTGASTGSTYLRGIQVSDGQGHVSFDTIYPGWYPGRPIHFHIEVYLSGNLKHTGQLFMPMQVTEAVKVVQPYSSRTDWPMPNDKDEIYKRSRGIDTTFENPQGDITSGFSVFMYVGINPTYTVRPSSGRRQ